MIKDEKDKLNILAKQIDAIAIDLSIIKTVLLGAPGSQNGGLVQKVETNVKSISRNSKCIYIAIGIAIGSGIFGGIQFFGI